MSTHRLNAIAQHIAPNHSAVETVVRQNPDDVVITLAIRTPITKGMRGGFKDTPVDAIVVKLLKEVINRMNMDPALVEDICLGNVNEPKAAYFCRAAALAAGFPVTTAANSVNRFCSSGLKAIQDIANEIAHGNISCGLAVGAESMSTNDGAFERIFVDEILEKSVAADCLQPMGQTSENVAKDFSISREKQDQYAVESYKRAENAQRNGLFDDEIVPITTTYTDPKSGSSKSVTLSKDEGPRWGTTYESLAKIRPAFPQYGECSTAGNSSQVSDGAAAILLMRRDMALRLHQPILAKFVGATVTGVPPRIMGVGPAYAIPKILEQYHLSLADIDVIEINEAFASMAVYCVEKLGLDTSKMNPRGGAIALGHPLGCTGARQVVTGLSECRRRKARLLLTSMCIGTGQGMAGLFVNEVL